jgi:hypothetical protein
LNGLERGLNVKPQIRNAELGRGPPRKLAAVDRSCPQPSSIEENYRISRQLHRSAGHNPVGAIENANRPVAHAIVDREGKVRL